MKAFVITIEDNELSEESADRTIKSAKKNGTDVENFKAITPGSSLLNEFNSDAIVTSKFSEVYSNFDSCLSAFYSHRNLWKKCVKMKENILILEHDAFFVGEVPEYLADRDACINLGRPSYGRYLIPYRLGLGPLESKQYFPGAHAYIVSPNKAKVLIKESIKEGKPTDVFLSNSKFDFLLEYYPWPVECRDSFTTIQKLAGCRAKHNFNESYLIL